MSFLPLKLQTQLEGGVHADVCPLLVFLKRTGHFAYSLLERGDVVMSSSIGSQCLPCVGRSGRSRVWLRV